MMSPESSPFKAVKTVNRARNNPHHSNNFQLMNRIRQAMEKMEMSASDKSEPDNETVLLATEATQKSTPSTVTKAQPQYLPNLRNLIFRNGIFGADNIVISVISLEECPHDAEAALAWQESQCPMFKMPCELFPHGAPLTKITFLPSELLPPLYDGGGVFPPGVLGHKFYPSGLLPAHHCGPTPPLFVGHRLVEKPLSHKRHYSGVMTFVFPVPSCSQPGSTRQPVHATESEAAPQPEHSNEQNGTQVRDDLSVGYIVARDGCLSQLEGFARPKTHYRIYVPDLSSVSMMVRNRTQFCVTVLSDLFHPHDPEVAFAVLRESPPKFRLPPKYFSSWTSSGRRNPVFLPKRFLPPGFGAGCVFSPGTLPETLFQSLFDKVFMQPVFIGQWTDKLTPAEYVFPQMENKVSSSEQDDKQDNHQDDQQDDEQDDEPNDKQDDRQGDKEDNNQDDHQDDNQDDKEYNEHEQDEQDDKQDNTQGENQTDQQDIGQDDQKYDEPDVVQDVMQDAVQDIMQGVMQVILKDIEQNVKQGDGRDDRQEYNRNNIESRLGKLHVNYIDGFCRSAQGKRRCCNTGGLWFFSLNGPPAYLEKSLKHLSKAGVKLASDYFDQDVLQRAHMQWMDLMMRKREKIARTTESGPVRVHESNPVLECSGDHIRRGRKCAKCGLNCSLIKKKYSRKIR